MNSNELAEEAVDALESAQANLEKLNSKVEVVDSELAQIAQGIAALHRNDDQLDLKQRTSRLQTARAHQELVTEDRKALQAQIDAAKKAVLDTATEAKTALFMAWSGVAESARLGAIAEIEAILDPSLLTVPIQNLVGAHRRAVRTRQMNENIAQLEPKADHQNLRGRFLEPLVAIVTAEV